MSELTCALKWDNQYFNLLLNNEWEKHMGPGGHWQWHMANSNKTKPNFLHVALFANPTSALASYGDF